MINKKLKIFGAFSHPDLVPFQTTSKARNDNTFGIHFILRMNKVKNGKAPLYARITVNASRIEVSLKTLVEISDWNPSKGLAKPKNEKAKELNSFLEQVRG